MPVIYGEQLKLLREAAGFATQRALAERSGIDPSRISKLEAGKSEEVNVRLGTLMRLAETLKVPVRVLFDEPGTIHDPDAKMRGLNEEDLGIARGYHDAPTVMRQRVQSLLHDGESDRVATLSKRLQQFSSAELDLVDAAVTGIDAARQNLRERKVGQS